MNIIDNRSKEALTAGSVLVMNNGNSFLTIKDVSHENYRLVKPDDMKTHYTFSEDNFNEAYIRRNYNIKEIIPASEVQLVIGGTK
ncbi:hypothetical protein [Bacillus thuringiensis]|uniref:hypothetical protein n=1 Tax=Bacillus thuringiensis TaxID=1428 RepID=UPI000BFCB927|nr:hypothetical protein [Bacillus thuringiensis]PGM50834.1 hypothetical protein CN949_16215 [Bacillus thuringiensis]